MYNGQERIAQTWYALHEYETFDITSRAYQARHHCSPSADKARQITSNFIQGREYFLSAASAARAVRPLLQYYGVLALARGLILFLSPTAKEANLVSGHGLGTHEWVSTLKGGTGEIGNLRIRLQKGIFHELLKATNNKFYFRMRSGSVNWSIGARLPDIGSEFTFRDISSRIPDIASQYNAWTGEPLAVLVLDQFRHDPNDDQYEWKVFGDEMHIESVFPASQFPNLSVSGMTIKHDPPNLPFIAQSSWALGMGQIHLYPSLSSSSNFTPLAACYMSAYTLGMLSRYFPTTWMRLGRSEKGDAIYPMVIRMLDWIEESFPFMAVDILRGPYPFESGSTASTR